VTGDPALRVIDADAGGDISRVIIGGAPALSGRGVADQAADFEARYDHLRWKLMRPPAGELHMCPVLLVDPREDAADLGVIIMESMGYPPISGSNLFCAVAVALETGLLAMQEPDTSLRVATPGGVVPVRARCRHGRCRSVAFDNAPAFVRAPFQAPGPSGPAPATLIAAGVDYAVAAAPALGLDLDTAGPAALVAAGQRLSRRAGTDFALFHDGLTVAGGRAECRVTVFQQPSVICRSPTGTGTTAMLVLAHAQGLIDNRGAITSRATGGGTFHGRIIGVDPGPGQPRLHTRISGEVRTGPPICIP